MRRAASVCAHPPPAHLPSLLRPCLPPASSCTTGTPTGSTRSSATAARRGAPSPPPPPTCEPEPPAAAGGCCRLHGWRVPLEAREAHGQAPAHPAPPWPPHPLPAATARCWTAPSAPPPSRWTWCRSGRRPLPAPAAALLPSPLGWRPSVGGQLLQPVPTPTNPPLLPPLCANPASPRPPPAPCSPRAPPGPARATRCPGRAGTCTWALAGARAWC